MSVIINNITNLAFVKGLELIFPLLTIPVLVHALGLGGYGEYVFAQTIISYIVIFINFGFDDVGVKLISSVSSSRRRTKIAINIIYIKFIFLIVAAFIYFFIIYNIDVNFKLYSSSFLIAVMDVINVFWFFQGVEKLKFFSFSSLITKIMYLFSVFIFVKVPNDIFLVPILFFVAFIIGNLPALYVFFTSYALKFNVLIPDESYMKKCFLAAFYVFLSNLTLAVKDKTGNIIAGVFIGKEGLAIYDLINKVIMIANQPAYIIITAYFPTFSRSYSVETANLVFKILLLLTCSILMLSVPLTWVIVPYFFKNTEQYLLGFQLSFLSCFFYAFSFFIGRNIFIAGNMMRCLFFGVILTSLFYVLGLSFIWFASCVSIVSLVLLSICTYAFEMLCRVFFSRKILGLV